MNAKTVKMLLAALLSMNLLQSPVQANILNFDTTFTDAIAPGAFTATALYVGYNFLIREDQLVKNQFPHAQTWYDAMAKKYPAAHLDTIQFVQKPKLSFIPDQLATFARQCNWSSSYNHIYFSEEALREITYIYKKVIDGYPLDDNEQFALARREFMLLHEAGHIEHHEARDITMTIIGFIAAYYGAEFVYDQIVQPAQTKAQAQANSLGGVIQLPELHWTVEKTLSAMNFPTNVPGVLTTAKGLTFMAGLIALLRYDEAKADRFARQHADSETLKGALTLFENDEVDRMFGIETKKMAPFIKTDSTIGNKIQDIANPIDYFVSYAFQQILLVLKSTEATLYLHDFSQDALHEGPSIRAQRIKDELAQRGE